MKKLTKEQKEINKIMSDWDWKEEQQKLVRVVWMDANTMSGTSEYDDIVDRGLIQAITVGYLIHENYERIAICGFMFPDSNTSILDSNNMTLFKDVHIIPKKWIKAVMVLKTDWEESKKFHKESKWLK